MPTISIVRPVALSSVPMLERRMEIYIAYGASIKWEFLFAVLAGNSILLIYN